MAAPHSADVSIAFFTSFDWVLVGIMVLSIVMAFWRGLVRVLFSLVFLVLGILTARRSYLGVGDWLHKWVPSLPTAQILAFLAILLAVWFAGGVIAAMVRQAVKKVGLGFADRVLGALFGFARGAAIGVAVMLAVSLSVTGSKWVANSVLAPYFLASAHAVSFVVPTPFEAPISSDARRLMKKNDRALKSTTDPQ